MRKMMLAGAAALAICSIPATLVAQDAVDPAMENDVTAPDSDAGMPRTPPPAGAEATDMAQTAKPSMTPQQQTTYDGWTPERQADYDAWAAEDQTYFWNLTPDRQKGFLALSPEQRGQIRQMTPQQQEMAWQSVMQQLQGQPPAPPMAQAETSGTAAPGSSAVSGSAATTAEPTAKEYPVCSKTVTDNCRNRGGV